MLKQPEMSRETYIQRFRDITEEMAKLTEAKNHDYGGNDDAWKNFREFGKLGILVRMSDKWARIKTALHEIREFKVKTETIIDTIRDLAVYCIILIIWIEAELSQSTLNDTKTTTT